MLFVILVFVPLFFYMISFFVLHTIEIKYPTIGEIPYPKSGTGKFPNTLEAKIAIK